MGRIIESAGVHVMVDAFVEDATVFNSANLTTLFHDLAVALDMTILVGPDFIEVPVDPEVLRKAQETGEFADEGGITGMCVISKSHMALHAWPLQKFFSMDVFSCADFDPEIALGLIRRLGVTSESTHIINRKKPMLMAPTVYCITNKVNGKRYVGKSKDPNSRWGMHVWLSSHPGHKAFSAIHGAIAKYGAANFVFQTLEVCATDEKAFEREVEWIATLRSNERGYGYNLTAGGVGLLQLSTETKAKRAAAVKGKLSGSNNAMFGRRGAAHPAFGTKRSEEVKRRLSEMRKGEGNPMFGRVVTPENRAAKSKAWEGASNPNQPRYTEEDVARILARRAEGATQRELATELGASQSVVSKMLNGKYRIATPTRSKA